MGLRFCEDFGVCPLAAYSKPLEEHEMLIKSMCDFLQIDIRANQFHRAEKGTTVP